MQRNDQQQDQQQAYSSPTRQADGTPLRRDTGKDAHAVETGLGAVVGGAVGGAVAGTAAGPVGTAVGAVAGAVLGAAAGRGIAEIVDPGVEDSYWREHHAGRPYYDSSYAYADYAPAYGYGLAAWQRHPGRPFDELDDAELGRGWERARGGSRLDWPRARHASRDAWQRLSDRVERAVPGDADRDGR